MLKRYLLWVSDTRMLWTSFIIMNAITFGIFKMLPNLDGLLIDLQFSYSQADLMAILEGIGPKGRATYVWANLIDMLFPIFYGSFFAGFLYRFRAHEGLWLLALVPILLAVVDWGENIQIRAMLLAYPDITAAQVDMASLFTTAKQILSKTMIGLFALTGIIATVRRIRGQG
jgi:hypothetical protein